MSAEQQSSLSGTNTSEPMQSTPIQKPPTPAKIDGARRMGVSFNPSKDLRIDILKAKFAELHDLIDQYSGEQMNKPNVDDGIARSEIGRNCALALTDLQKAKWAAVEAVTR